jgi:DNA-binding FadR family transcriptional regulator
MRTVPSSVAPSRERAAALVVRAIEEQVISGALADGIHLPAERDLMDMFGVSRTVIREAVTLLASRGLLEAKPRFRPIVRRPGFEAAVAALDGIVTHLLKDPAGVKNVFDLRILLESGLVRHAALNARREDISALEKAIEANQAAIEDSDRFYATDVAFHGVLYQIPRNPVLPAIHHAFVAWLAKHWERMPRSPERNRINYLRHRDIYDAIVARDPDGAEAAMRAHLNAAWEFVRGTFDET